MSGIGMMRRESASMAADGMNTTQGGISIIDGDGQIKPKKREKKQILPPYKNKTALKISWKIEKFCFKIIF